MCRMNHVHGPTELGYSSCMSSGEQILSQTVSGLPPRVGSQSGSDPGASRSSCSSSKSPIARHVFLLVGYGSAGPPLAVSNLPTNRLATTKRAPAAPEMGYWERFGRSKHKPRDAEPTAGLKVKMRRKRKMRRKNPGQKLAGEQRANLRAHVGQNRGAEIKSNFLYH